jgi:hypothetical protein
MSVSKGSVVLHFLEICRIIIIRGNVTIDPCDAALDILWFYFQVILDVETRVLSNIKSK